MNILLTGGTGFLGKEMIEYFSQKHRIYATYRHGKGVSTKNVSWIRIDLTKKQDFYDVRNTLRKAKIDVVIHAGGATPNRAYADGHFHSTTIGTKNVLDLAKYLSVKKIIFISTISVLLSKGPYANSKKEAEWLVTSSGLRYVILRPETIIGPGAKDFNRMAEMISKHRIFPMVGSGKNLTQPISSFDVVRMVESCLHTNRMDGRIYHAVGKDVLTMRTLMKKIAAAKGRDIALIPLPLWLLYPLSVIVGWICPKTGFNHERVKTLSASRSYPLDHLKDFGMDKDSLKSFDEMIGFLRH